MFSRWAEKSWRFLSFLKLWDGRINLHTLRLTLKCCCSLSKHVSSRAEEAALVITPKLHLVGCVCGVCYSASASYVLWNRCFCCDIKVQSFGGCGCWLDVELRAPGGYLSPRGSECSPVGSPPPLLLGEAEGIWIRVPPGPCGAPSWKDPGELKDCRPGLTCLFVCLFGDDIQELLSKFLWKMDPLILKQWRVVTFDASHVCLSIVKLHINMTTSLFARRCAQTTRWSVFTRHFHTPLCTQSCSRLHLVSVQRDEKKNFFQTVSPSEPERPETGKSLGRRRHQT